MAETAAPVATPIPTAAPAAPAAGAPTPPTTSSATAAQKPPHHSAMQPRTEVGTFDKKGGTPAPQVYEIDGRKLTADDLRAALAERQEDERAFRAEREELSRLRQEQQRWKEPTRALTPEQRREIARLELLEFQRQQDEAKLPPEQRAFLQQKREFERQQAEFQRQREEQEQQALHAQQMEQRQQAAANVQAALKALGTDENDSLAVRLVADEFWMASQQGKEYPPAVIARRVQRQLDAIASQRAVKLGPKALLGNAEFVSALNALDDEALLRALAPLGERLRTLNLQARGLTSTPPPQPSNVVPLPTGQQPRTDSDWIQHFRSTGAPDSSNAAAHAKYWALKDRGVL